MIGWQLIFNMCNLCSKVIGKVILTYQIAQVRTINGERIQHKDYLLSL